MHASPDDLRRLAATLDAVRLELDRHRIAATGGLSAPIGADPEWAATAALDRLTAVLDEGLAQVARRCDDTAAAVRTAAGAYEAADERAVRRLHACRGGTW